MPIHNSYLRSFRRNCWNFPALVTLYKTSLIYGWKYVLCRARSVSWARLTVDFDWSLIVFFFFFYFIFLEPYESACLSYPILPIIVVSYVYPTEYVAGIHSFSHSVISHLLPPTYGPGYRRDIAICTEHVVDSSGVLQPPPTRQSLAVKTRQQ